MRKAKRFIGLYFVVFLRCGARPATDLSLLFSAFLSWVSFRGARSHLDSQHCQAEEEDKPDFHFNWIFIVASLVKWEVLASDSNTVSMAYLKISISIEATLKLYYRSWIKDHPYLSFMYIEFCTSFVVIALSLQR